MNQWKLTSSILFYSHLRFYSLVLFFVLNCTSCVILFMALSMLPCLGGRKVRKRHFRTLGNRRNDRALLPDHSPHISGRTLRPGPQAPGLETYTRGQSRQRCRQMYARCQRRSLHPLLSSRFLFLGFKSLLCILALSCVCLCLCFVLSIACLCFPSSRKSLHTVVQNGANGCLST